MLSSDRKYVEVPFGEVRFLVGDRLETGEEQSSDGSHSISFLDHHQDDQNNSSVLKTLTSSNLGSYWDLEDESDQEESDNNDENFGRNDVEDEYRWMTIQTDSS